MHFGFFIDTGIGLPSAARTIAGATGAGNLSLRLNTSGTLSVMSGTSVVGSSTVALVAGQWYWIGFANRANATNAVLLQIDGVDQVTGSLSGLTTAGVIGAPGGEAAGIKAWFDDVIGDDAGLLQPSKVALLSPISDNARATLWTGGTGGTTNLFDAVNNTPPIGTATETNLTQIEHAGNASGTTDAYDANMTTYASAGIGASDTVLAIDFGIVHGEDVTTGSKLLAMGIASNPTVANTASFTVGADSGALGTYPTNWRMSWRSDLVGGGGVVQSPSVTIANSPVMRVTRPETASRVASVCFMGMYVAWTPSAVTQVPYYQPYPQILSQ